MVPQNDKWTTCEFQCGNDKWTTFEFQWENDKWTTCRLSAASKQWMKYKGTTWLFPSNFGEDKQRQVLEI